MAKDLNACFGITSVYAWFQSFSWLVKAITLLRNVSKINREVLSLLRFIT